jgi:hypothetical protein
MDATVTKVLAEVLRTRNFDVQNRHGVDFVHEHHKLKGDSSKIHLTMFIEKSFSQRNYDFNYREKWYSGLTGPGGRWKAVSCREENRAT